MPKYKLKYELTDETIVFRKCKLFRIRALRDFSPRFETRLLDVKAGDLGGWVASEDNLSHEGLCWIHNEAKAFEGARVKHEAWLCSRAFLHGQATVGGHAVVSKEACVGGQAEVGGQAYIGGRVSVGGKASVGGEANIVGDVQLSGNAKVGGTAFMAGNIHITTGHFTSGDFYAQDEIAAYLAEQKTKGQTHAHI